MRKSILSMIIVSLCFCSCGGQDELISSLQYQMLLLPVRRIMNEKSLRSLEDAIVNTLIMYQLTAGDIRFFPKKVNFQDVKHRASNDSDSEDTASTAVLFIVFGGTLLNDTDSQLQKEFGQLVEASFSSDTSIKYFMFLISSDPILREVLTVSIRRHANVTFDRSESQSQATQSFSLLDVLLTSSSGLILLGMLYIFVQHHIKCGCPKNEQIVLSNRPQYDPSEQAGSDRSVMTQISNSIPIWDKKLSPCTPNQEAAGRTQPASVMADVEYILNNAAVGRLVRMTTNAASASDPIVAISSAVHKNPLHSLLYDGHVSSMNYPMMSLPLMWRPLGAWKNPAQSVSAFLESDNEEDSSCESMSEYSTNSSVDVFNVDICSLSAESKTHAAFAVTEWMKTIRVVLAHKDHFVPVLSQSSSMSTANIDEKQQEVQSLPSFSSDTTPPPTPSLTSSMPSLSGFSTETSSSSYDSSSMNILSNMSALSFRHKSLEHSITLSHTAINRMEKMEV